MKKEIIITVIILILIIIGGYFLFGSNQESGQIIQSDVDNLDELQGIQDEEEMEESNNDDQSETESINEINYTNSGFSSRTITIKVGETVKWNNQSSFGMWVASDLHPTHSAYSGTTLQQHCPNTNNEAFDQCASSQPGGSWSFTFLKKGEWNYHNHLRPSDVGIIIVE